MILKTDSRGRVRTPPEQRATLVAEFERSGLSATKFAALVGVRYQTLATWVQRQRQQRKAATKGRGRPRTQAVRFAELVLDGAAPQAQRPALRVLLPGGAVLELADSRQTALAAQFIKALV